MKVMVVAGEASGDLHGANLARAITALEPQVTLFGMGGRLMQQAGVELLYNPTETSTMGLVEVLKSVRQLRRVLSQMAAALDERKPDVLVTIDFPDFNMRLAEIAHKRGVPVVYYISPSVWAWRRGRARQIARTVRCVCSIFPFEVDIYRQAGAPVCFVGHPLLDIVQSTVTKEALLPQLGLQADKPFFALLPGSREQEIRSLLGPMLQAAKIVASQAPGAQFAVPVAHTISHTKVEEFTSQAGMPSVALVEGRTYDVLAAADAAIIASGTATLEAAILGTPMVMVYHMANATYRILKLLVKTPYVALPNIVAGRKIVEELLQDDVNPERMAAELLSIWQNAEKRAAIKQGLAEAVERLGQPGAVQRTAQAVVAVAKHEDPLVYSVE